MKLNDFIEKAEILLVDNAFDFDINQWENEYADEVNESFDKLFLEASQQKPNFTKYKLDAEAIKEIVDKFSKSDFAIINGETSWKTYQFLKKNGLTFDDLKPILRNLKTTDYIENSVPADQTVGYNEAIIFIKNSKIKELGPFNLYIKLDYDMTEEVPVIVISIYQDYKKNEAVHELYEALLKEDNEFGKYKDQFIKAILTQNSTALHKGAESRKIYDRHTGEMEDKLLWDSVLHHIDGNHDNNPFDFSNYTLIQCDNYSTAMLIHRLIHLLSYAENGIAAKDIKDKIRSYNAEFIILIDNVLKIQDFDSWWNTVGHIIIDSVSDKIADMQPGKKIMLEDLDDAKSIIADQIRGEWEAIQNYNKAVHDLSNINGNFKEIVDILNDISNEEEVHVGELEQAQALMDKDLLDNIDDGHDEAQETIEQKQEETDMNESKQLTESSYTLKSCQFKDGYYLEYRWDKYNGFEILGGPERDGIVRNEFSKAHLTKETAARTFERYKKHLMTDHGEIESEQDEEEPKVESLNEKVETSQLNEIDKFLEDIYELRKDGLQKTGEYGIENLTFKELRNKGYLDNLKDLKNKLIGKELSLESLENTVDSDLADVRQPVTNNEVELKEPVNYKQEIAKEKGLVEAIYDVTYFDHPNSDRKAKITIEASSKEEAEKMVYARPEAKQYDNVVWGLRGSNAEGIYGYMVVFDYEYYYNGKPDSYKPYDERMLIKAKSESQAKRYYMNHYYGKFNASMYLNDDSKLMDEPTEKGQCMRCGRVREVEQFIDDIDRVNKIERDATNESLEEDNNLDEASSNLSTADKMQMFNGWLSAGRPSVYNKDYYRKENITACGEEKLRAFRSACLQNNYDLALDEVEKEMVNRRLLKMTTKQEREARRQQQAGLLPTLVWSDIQPIDARFVKDNANRPSEFIKHFGNQVETIKQQVIYLIWAILLKQNHLVDIIKNNLVTNERINVADLKANITKVLDDKKIMERISNCLATITESLEESYYSDRELEEFKIKIWQLAHSQPIVQRNGMFNIYNVLENDVNGILGKLRSLDFIDYVNKDSGKFDFSKPAMPGKGQPRKYNIYGKIKEKEEQN